MFFVDMLVRRDDNPEEWNLRPFSESKCVAFLDQIHVQDF